MTPDEQEELLNQFFNNLEDKPLEPTDDFYYPFLEDTDDDPIAELDNRIRLSQSQSVNLFTGQRGSGKSTEFRRLKKILNGKGCEVFLLDMQEYMNLTTPVEISDFLIAIMTALSEEVEQRFKQAPHQRAYLEQLGDFFTSEIKLGEIEISGIKASLKDDPSFKKRLQDGMKGHIARIVKDAHGFAQEVVELIRSEKKDKDKKVVVLVDSVEKLRGVGAEGADAVYKSVENLFSGFASSLQIPMLHIVYTIPPYLTPLAPGLGRQLGANLGCTLPCVHVRTRENGTDDDGLKIMREFVRRRCPQPWEEIFHQTKLDKLAKASGGDLREFFRLIRDSLVKASTKNIYPIPDAVIERTLNHARREMLPIAQTDKDWLIKINASKDAELENMADLPALARFFDTKLVLNYRNGDDWYDVHPLLCEEIRK